MNLGFAAALAQRGITDLSGKTPEEIVMTLADIFGGPASLIDETALREALIALMQDWTEDVQTIEGLDQAVLRAAQDISVTLRRFLAHYIFEVYKTVGYHGILEQHGYEKAEGMVGQIRQFIDSKVNVVNSTRNLASIDWMGDEGARIVNGIVKDTVAIFSEGEQ